MKQQTTGLMMILPSGKALRIMHFVILENYSNIS